MGYWISTEYPFLGTHPQKFSSLRRRRKFWIGDPELCKSPAFGGKIWANGPELYKSPAKGGKIRPLAEILGYWISTGYPIFGDAVPKSSRVSAKGGNSGSPTQKLYKSPAKGGIIRPLAEILGYWISTGYPKFGDAVPKSSRVSAKGGKSGPSAQKLYKSPAEGGKSGSRSRILQVSRQRREIRPLAEILGYWISTGYPFFWGRRPQKFSSLRQRRKIWAVGPETLQVSRRRREIWIKDPGFYKSPAKGGIIRPSAEILGYWISTGYPIFGDAVPKSSRVSAKGGKSGSETQNSTSLPPKAGKSGPKVQKLYKSPAFGGKFGLRPIVCTRDIHWISIFWGRRPQKFSSLRQRRKIWVGDPETLQVSRLWREIRPMAEILSYWISTGYPEIWGCRPQKFSSLRQRRKPWIKIQDSTRSRLWREFRSVTEFRMFSSKS